MYCNYCGKVIQDDASHCAYCGKRIGSAVARRRLVRPRGDRKIAGVCAGFAEYFDLDVTLVRLVWLITAVMTGHRIAFVSHRLGRDAGRTAAARGAGRAPGCGFVIAGCVDSDTSCPTALKFAFVCSIFG